MQIVKRVNPNVSPIMDDIDRLYCQLSEEEKTIPFVAQRYDSSFQMVVGTFLECSGYTWTIEFEEREYAQLQPIENNNLILNFSGGKDSVASALKYKEEGYNVYLYHMRHINPALSDEWEKAKKLADMLGLPIYFDDIHFSGHHMWMEHPMKNMLIANGALSYGIREGIGTRVAFGNYTTSYLEDNAFDRCAGDCMDMWEAYEEIIHRVLPEFTIEANLENMGDTLNILVDHRDLLENTLSCLCRHSLRDYRHNWVKEKYGIELFPYRCGSCYKCCVEYIYMADHDKFPFSAEYYKYCLGQLYRVARAEKIRVRGVADIWNNFIFYPMEKSRLYYEMTRTKLLSDKIKWQ